MRFVLVFLVGFSLSSLAAPDFSRRCGGDGPQPFLDLTGAAPKTKVVPVKGSIKEFLYWEHRDSLVYRNERNEVLSYSFGSHHTAYFGGSQAALSPVIDAKESMLLLQGVNWLFTTDGWWRNYYSSADRPQHLFWDGKLLYDLDDQQFGPKYPQQLNIHRYRVGFSSARPLCQWKAPVGKVFKLAEGSEFPNLTLYTVEKSAQGNKVTLYEMDVRTCTVKNGFAYSDLFDGDILAVHRFVKLNSYAIHVDHPTKNLMWDYGTGCHYYDIGKGPALVPNHSRPIVATWDASDGLKVMNLKMRSRGEYFAGSKFKSLARRDVWLQDRGDELFFAPVLEQDGSKMVLELDASEIVH